MPMADSTWRDYFAFRHLIPELLGQFLEQPTWLERPVRPCINTQRIERDTDEGGLPTEPI
jgi:hypothetical protein